MKMIKWFVMVVCFFILVGCGLNNLRSGAEYFGKGDFTKAIDSFTKTIQSNPSEQEAYFFRGAAFSATGQFDQAIKDYTKVIELNPQHKEAYWSRGYCYQNKKMDDKAIVDYTESLNLNTKMKPLVYQLRAGAYFRKSMLVEAEKDLESALQLEPENKKALRSLEEIKKAKADPAFDPFALKYRPIEEQPQYGEVPLSAEIEKINADFVREVTKAYGTKEKAAERALERAWEFYNQGDYSTSMKRFNQAWLLDKNNPEIFRGYSLILQAWGYTSEAEKWEQKTEGEIR